ncbi:MAG: hypothetical protein RIS94_1286 [Pseudomonadota bacterium]|jgi:hypothetical protein
MVLARLACLFDRHRPLREGVRWNGTHYVAGCRHCGKAIQRQTHCGWRSAPPEPPAPLI